jgi:hypothetical protein
VLHQVGVLFDPLNKYILLRNSKSSYSVCPTKVQDLHI